jgi:putative acetyltransferase
MVVTGGSGTSGVSERIEAVDRPPSQARHESVAGAIVTAREPFDSAGPRWVVTQAQAELVTRYGFLDSGELHLTAAMFDPPGGAFLVARTSSDAPPIGGVGLRPVDEWTGEIKRLWVDPGCRGSGTARTLMALAEATARELGYRALRLETGARQPEAIALYDSIGWARRETDWDGGPLPGGSFHFAKELRPLKSVGDPSGR